MVWALVLDLDRTLVHTVNAPREGPHFLLSHSTELYVHVRPGARELFDVLDTKAETVRVVVWTAGNESYARAVLEGILGKTWAERVDLVLSRDDAYLLPSGQFAKNLDVVRRILQLEWVILVDDDPVHSTVPANTCSVLRAPPFEAGNVHDTFLWSLATAV